MKPKLSALIDRAKRDLRTCDYRARDRVRSRLRALEVARQIRKECRGRK
jgi:hypothetical protein